jgi:hypothetical protein
VASKSIFGVAMEACLACLAARDHAACTDTALATGRNVCSTNLAEGDVRYRQRQTNSPIVCGGPRLGVPP